MCSCKKAVTRRTELICTSLLIAFALWCFHQHRLGRAAIARKMAIVDEQFFEAMDEEKRLHEESDEIIEGVFSWGEPFTDGASQGNS